MQHANPYAPPGMDDGGYLPPGGTPGGGQPQAWAVGEVLTQAWEILKRQPLLAVGLFIMYVIPQLFSGVGNILQASGVFERDSMVMALLMVSTSLVGMLVSLFLQVGAIRLFVAAARGEEAQLGVLFSGGDRFLPMIGYYFLSGLATLIGLVLFIVPGVIVALGFALGSYYLIDQRQGVIQSLQSSWEATKDDRLNLFVFFLVAGGLTLLGLCACFVGTFVTTTIVMIAMALIYLRRSGQAGQGGPPVGGPGGTPGLPQAPPGGFSAPGGFSPPGAAPGGGYSPQGMG